MLSAGDNKLLTEVGPGTAMGEVLRRYWQPVGAVSELRDVSTVRVTLLGERLVLYKDRSGKVGLIDESCPHRRASMAYAIPDERGLRCPYHGWLMNGEGRCLDQPNEPPGSNAKERIKVKAYPVQELGGLYFAYLGPEPRPLLPRFDGFVVNPAIRMIGRAIVPVNWLQIMENSVDPIHTEWLHGHMFEHIASKEGLKVPISRHHEQIAFDEFPFGIIKRRRLAAQSEDCDDWKVGHPLVFPNMLAVGNGNPNTRIYMFQIRVPMDNTHTMHYWYNAYIPPSGASVPQRLLEEAPIYDVPFRREDGSYMVDFIDGQDIMAWITQGEVADRTAENLVDSDVGIVRFRRMLQRESKKVQAGQDPLGTVRDPAANEMIALPVERDKHHFSGNFAAFSLKRTQARYSPIMEDLAAIYAGA